MGARRSGPVPVEELLAEAGWLRTLAGRLARDSASADDLAQGTLAAALEHPPAVDQPLRPWLATVLRNLVRATRRADGRRRDREQRAARSEALTAEDDVLAQFDEQRRLAELVVRLDEPYRSVLLRHYYRGESAAQIARATGQPSATVRSQLARATARLRELHLREHRGSAHHSLAALEVAAGSQAHSWIAGTALAASSSLVAMKTTAKLVTAAAVVVLGLVGVRELQRAQGPAGTGPAGGEPSAATLAAPAVDRSASTPAASAPGSTERMPVSPLSPASAPVETDAEAAPAPTAFALRAVDGQGSPIAGARVSFAHYRGRPGDRPPSAPSGGDGRVVAEVDTGATFRYMSDEVRRSIVVLTAPGYAASLFVEEVAKGATVELGDRILQPGGDVVGRVVDAGGLGVAGASVVAMAEQPEGSAMVISGPVGPMEGGLDLQTVSGPDGEFTLAGLQLRATRLWYRLPGRNWSQSEPLRLEAGEVRAGVELVLPPSDPSQLITGRVLLPDGAPAAGARVRVLTGGGMVFQPPAVDETLRVGDDGRFALEPLIDAPLRLIAEDPDGEHSPSLVATVTAGDPELRMQLEPLRRLGVRVVDGAGEPIERAWMMVYVGDASIGGSWRYTDAEGRQDLPIPAETFKLLVGRDGFESRTLEDLVPNQLGDELLVELEAHPELRGIVLANGQPVAGASVQLVYSWGESHREVFKGFTSRFFKQDDPVDSGADGRFAVPLNDPEDRIWTLLVEKEGLALAEVSIGQIVDVAAVPEVEVTMTGGGILEGRLRVPAGRTPAGMVVGCSREDGRPQFARVDEDGGFRFEHLAPGPWLVEGRDAMPEGRSISVVEAERMPFEPNAVVREGETTTIEVDTGWKDDLAIEGRLTFDGVGATGWTAFVDPGHHVERPPGFEPVALDEQGRFAAPALPGPGSLILRSAPESPIARLIELELTVGRDNGPVELAFGTGTVRGSGHEPGTELRVAQPLEVGGFAHTTFVADADGSFEVGGIPAGEIGLMVSGDRGWERVAEHRLTPGEVWTVD